MDYPSRGASPVPSFMRATASQVNKRTAGGDGLAEARAIDAADLFTRGASRSKFVTSTRETPVGRAPILRGRALSSTPPQAVASGPSGARDDIDAPLDESWGAALSAQAAGSTSRSTACSVHDRPPYTAPPNMVTCYNILRERRSGSDLLSARACAGFPCCLKLAACGLKCRLRVTRRAVDTPFVADLTVHILASCAL
jgi:hypothetical protein